MTAASLRDDACSMYLPHRAHWLADRSQDLIDCTLGDLLRKAATEVPDRIALVEGVADHAQRRRWTYRELLADSENMARALLAKFTPGERVAVYAANSPEWVLLQHGMSFAGLILVPVNPAYTARELLYVVEDSKAAGLFYDEVYRERDLVAVIDDIRAKGLTHLREVIAIPCVHDLMAASDLSKALPEIEPTDTLQIQYTSGTTGSPKGALLHHKGVTNTARNIAIRMQFPDGGVHINAMPMFHIAGAAVAEMGVIAFRGTFVLMPHFDAGLMIELFESERGNATLIVPTMILSILNHPALKTHDVSSWRTILSGAANVSAALVRQVHRDIGCKVCVIFGQTESNGPITLSAPDDLIEDQTDTVGKPLPHVDVRVVDTESCETVPVDEIGELWVKGYQTMSGYFNMADQSAETIRPDGWLRTGDLGTMDWRGYVKVSLLLLAVAAAMPTAATAQDRHYSANSDYAHGPQKLVDKAASVVGEMWRDPNIRPLMREAVGMYIIPEFGRGGFIIGGKGGAGVVVAKGRNGWTSPAFFNTGGLSIGLQAGGEGGSIVYLLMDSRAVDAFLTRNKFSIGAGAGLSVVTYSTAGDISSLKGDAILWTNTKGAYAGATVGASNIDYDEGRTREYYGRNVRVSALFAGDVSVPGARALTSVLPR